MPQSPPETMGRRDKTDDATDLGALFAPLSGHVRLLLIGPILVASLALLATFLIKPTFTARTSFIPPQQQQTATASALASLGALAGLAGTASGAVRTPADQYAALMQSMTVANRLIDQFGLVRQYDVEFRFEAQRELQRNVRIAVGKRDGLITVEVDDESPQRAADIANAHVDELRRMTTTLAVTEAQQRRVFFEQHFKRSSEQLSAAQEALQSSGFSQGALNAEPKAAAERYARLRAEATAAEVRLQTMSSSLSDATPEMRQQRSTLAALKTQLAKAEQAPQTAPSSGYVSKYREFKYQEALFELFARQYEMARVDESREGALVQVIDKALPPERKSRPRRAVTALVAYAASAALLLGVLVLRRPDRPRQVDATP